MVMLLVLLLVLLLVVVVVVLVLQLLLLLWLRRRLRLMCKIQEGHADVTKGTQAITNRRSLRPNTRLSRKVD